MNDTKELISAIEKVRSYCHNQEKCLRCVFYDLDLDCCNIQGIPDEWVRFSQDEVKLAKALKKYGASRIVREGMVTYWGTKDRYRFGGYLPKGMFEILGETEEVSIDEVIGNADL